MTIEFSNTGSFSFTDLTFTADLVSGISWGQATTRFRLSNLPSGVTVLVSNILLKGDGIINTLSMPNVTLNSTSYSSPNYVALDTIADPWQSVNNTVSFNIQINGGSLIPGTTLEYILSYSTSFFDITSRFGNVSLSAIAAAPQPTFGLPASTVALITSRFGSVANFLRLRNQGYV